MSSKHAVLREVFGFDDFRPGQEAIVDHLLAGRNVLAVMPTGAGKSLTYQVPALVKGGLTIVVSPLVALMQDQVAALKLAGVAAETINSTASREENVAIWRRVAAGEVRILYLAPERLMTDRMIAALQRIGVSLIAVDEAHCISQWGASFRPEYDALQELRTAFPGVPIGAVTATADEATRRDIVEKLFGGEAELYVAGFDRPNIRLTVEPKSNTKRQLLAFLEGRPSESGIVYALSRKSSEELAAFLSDNGYRAVPYHAGLSPEKRAEAQELFMAETGVIVCATIAFGMGIDKPDVRFVFHADLPGSLDAYYQEIGRAGRDGKPAEAHMVFGLQDISMRRRFIDQEHEEGERRRREHKRLDALVAYCEAPECRRQSLLSYFGEAAAPCGNCDVCINPVATVDGGDDARKILLTAQMTGERFGATHLVDLLIGKANPRAQALGHDQLPVFAAGRNQGRNVWQSLIRQLVGGGYLTIDVAGHGGISIAPKGHDLLEGRIEFRYRPDMIRPAGGKSGTRAPAEADPDVPRALLDRLKARRTELAREQSVPTYVIFPDRTLIDMARKLPRTRRDFENLHGVGAAKLERFADTFLEVIRLYSDEVEA
ncbi:DNA helicase RecQ [Oricola thermophila]|uniref:DNA helicase RecQ n=1 Tax=Oricola thermophila TaxID=2742145 RepID=A0A6N1VGR7_9HYPH|nr:DNA helicase RecQ [Oricola thermophila]QKV18855.1 DNA helicase RecQ [Oricola thermophila]